METANNNKILHIPRMQYEQIVSDSNPVYGNLSSRKGQASLSKRLILFPAILCSIVAALPVPYLVFKSLYLLTHHNQNISYHEMIKTNNILFWIFGPLASIIATLAVAPFNMYNTYKTVTSFKNTNFSAQSLTFSQIPYAVVRILALSFGIVNGYNMFIAYNDVVCSRVLISIIIRVFVVTIAIIFAGLDSRVAINKFAQEAPQDWRYFKRLLNYVTDTKHTGNNFSPISTTTYNSIQEFKLVNNNVFSKEECDDQRQIIIYGKPYVELITHHSLIDNTDWIRYTNSQTFQNYLLFINDDFPIWRYFAGDVFGSILSLILGIFNSFNAWNYAQIATINFLTSIGINKHNVMLQIIAKSTALITSIISILMSFYLIRDLFFRNIFKKSNHKYNYKNIMMKVFTLIPALCFALLNVAMTIMNDSIDSTTKLFVSISAVLGSTTVLRYSIEGALEEWRGGEKDLRKQFAKIPERLITTTDTF